MRSSLPAAAFGKSISGSKKSDSYGILFQTVDFPTNAVAALRRLAASVEWPGDAAETTYPSCYAVWPISPPTNGLLVARLLDAGRDSFGRPHTLRIEAVFLDADRITLEISSMVISPYLAPGAWPEILWAGPPSHLELNPDTSDDYIDRWFRKVAADVEQIPRFLVATGSPLKHKGFDNIHGPDPVEFCPPNTNAPKLDRTAAETYRPIPLEPGRAGRGLRRIRTFFLGAVSGAVIAYAVPEARHLQVNRDLEGQNAGIKVQLKKTQQDLVDERKRLKDSQQQCERSRKQLAAEHSSHQPYRDVLQEFQIDGPEVLRERLEQLKRIELDEIGGVKVHDKLRRHH